MFKRSLLLLSCTVISLYGGSIKPKVVHATDYPRHYRGSTGVRKADPLISTSEASAQISSLLSLEASSQATTNPAGRGNPRAYSFLEENRIEITEEIAKGEGEHLQTLLGLMHLKADETTLLALQSNFEQLIYLNPEQFLTQLSQMSS